MFLDMRAKIVRQQRQDKRRFLELATVIILLKGSL
jgi:hypothetical protein